jgi:outer membrane protein W
VSAAFTAGLTYRLSDRWHLHGSFGFSQVKTHLTTNTDGIVRTSNVSFAPTPIIVSIGYSFGH